MLILAGAILIASILISITLARGFTRMSDALTSAEDALISVSTQLIADVSNSLTAIANSISEHIANGTAASVIQAQADKLKALDASVEAAMAPPAPPVVEPPPADTTTAPEPVDTLAGGNADDSVSA